MHLLQGLRMKNDNWNQQGVKKLEAKKQWLPKYQDYPIGAALIEGKTDAGLIGPGSFCRDKVSGWRLTVL